MRFTNILCLAASVLAWQIIIDPEVLKPVIATTATTATTTNSIGETVGVLAATTTYDCNKTHTTYYATTAEESVIVLEAPTTTIPYTMAYTTPVVYTTTEERVIVLEAPTTTIPYTMVYTTPVVYTTTTTEESVIVLEAPSTTTIPIYTSVVYTTPVVYTSETTTTTEEPIVILQATTTTTTISYTVVYTTETTTTETTTTAETPVIILEAPTTTVVYTTPYVVFCTTKWIKTYPTNVVLQSAGNDIDPEMYFTKKTDSIATPVTLQATTSVSTTTVPTVVITTCPGTSTVSTISTECPSAVTVTVTVTATVTESVSATSTPETFCDSVDLALANGTQNRNGSCSLAVLGAIPSVENMISTLILEPLDGTIILIGETILVRIKSSNIDFGNFDDPNAEYYTGPQTLSGAGLILGHSHITLEKIEDATVFPDPSTPVFFRGFDGEPVDGELSTSISADLLAASGPGVYRLCTITTSQSHRPIFLAIARRGSVDDCIRFTIL